MNLFAKQKQRHRGREQMQGHQGGKESRGEGPNEQGNWDGHIYTTMYKIDN